MKRRFRFRFHFATALLAALAFSGPTRACIWDRDTIESEQQQYPGVMELITGRFVRHSPEYYSWRVKDRERILKYEKPTPELFDDLAVAYEKLGNHEKAIALMLEKEKLFPGLYETRANLGTFYIHAGQFEKGVEQIDLAIAINPDAHFGREIYQKHLVNYLLSKQVDGVTSLPLDTSDRLNMNAPMGFAKYLLKIEGVPESASELPKRAVLQKAQKGIEGMMRFGNYNSPVLLEALADVILSQNNPEYGKNLAARAFLQASYVAKDEAAKQAYHERGTELVAALNMGSLDQIEEKLTDELIEGSKFFEKIAANEAKWIAEGKNVDEAFADRYYDPPGTFAATPPAPPEKPLQHHVSSWGTSSPQNSAHRVVLPMVTSIPALILAVTLFVVFLWAMYRLVQRVSPSAPQTPPAEQPGPVSQAVGDGPASAKTTATTVAD